MRQALAGMLWSKQWFISTFADGSKGTHPARAVPGSEAGRNADWAHLYNDDVISMPDKWEYPWYAGVDLAFHAISIALVDSDFARTSSFCFSGSGTCTRTADSRLRVGLRRRQPTVHAWAAFRVYKIEKRIRGKGDRQFLERVFQKLLLNFTWWINRKDPEGKNVFQGGFLGLDNIGSLTARRRSRPRPHRAVGCTAWMGMYCLNMLGIALELASKDPAYEDMASKFFEHFMYIAQAMGHMGHKGIGLWNEEDGFFYDVLHTPDGVFP